MRHDGTDAVSAVRSFDPEVLVLDLGLPGIDGIEVCRQVRALFNCHVLMLTARDDEIDKIVGLSVGADDYVTKPFSPRELVARVQAMLRRSRTNIDEAPAGSESPHAGNRWMAMSPTRASPSAASMPTNRVVGRTEAFSMAPAPLPDVLLKSCAPSFPSRKGG